MQTGHSAGHICYMQQYRAGAIVVGAKLCTKILLEFESVTMAIVVKDLVAMIMGEVRGT